MCKERFKIIELAIFHTFGIVHSFQNDIFKKKRKKKKKEGISGCLNVKIL